MSNEELKIRVSVPGAAEAAGELGKVAEGERKVGQAGQAATPAVQGSADAKKAAAQQTRELNDRNRTLAERMRALGPEFGLLGDLVDSLTLKQGAQAAAVGVLGVAILGATMLIQRFTAAQEEEKQKAEQVRAALMDQLKAYTDIAEKVEDVRRAEERRGLAAAGPGTAETIRKLTDISAGGVPLGGKQGIGEIASAAAGGEFTDEQLSAFAMWMRLQYDKEYKVSEPYEIRAAFRADLTKDPSLPARLRREIEVLKANAPDVGRREIHEARMGQREREPGARLGTALQMIADLKDMKPAEAEAYVADLAAAEAARMRSGRPEGDQSAEFRKLLADYPVLREVRAFDEEAFRSRLRFGQPFAEGTVGALTQIGGGRTLGQMAGIGPEGFEGAQAMVVNHFHGGVVTINQDKTDPAGVPVERQAP